MSVTQAILLAILFAFCCGCTPAFSFTFHIGYTMMYPVVLGPIIGLIMGDVWTGMAMGATINLVYLGLVSVGGETPSSPPLAAIFGIGLGIAAGVDVETAVSLGVPFGLIGSVLPTLIRVVNIFFVQRIQKNIKGRQIGKMKFWFYMTVVFRFLLQFILVFIGLYLGSKAVNSVLGWIPAWGMNGLRVIGKMLPAMGFAAGILAVLKKNEEMVYFIIAFLGAKYLGVPVVFCTVIGAMLAWYKIAVKMRQKEERLADDYAEQAALADQQAEQEEVRAAAKTAAKSLGKGALVRYALYNWVFSQTCFNYEDYNGTGKAVCLLPLLKALYPNNPDKWCERMEAHMVYFNSNPPVESLIHGMVASMEEQIADGADISNDAVIAVKAGLMGPLAGVGDSTLQGVVMPIIITMGINMCTSMPNSLAGPIFAFGVHFLIIAALVAVLFYLGYKGGKVVIEKIFGGDAMEYISEAGAIVALASFGALAASTISFTCGLTFNETPVQDILDTLLKGLLPLITVLLSYRARKKGMSSLKLLLIIIVVAFVGGALTIFA